MTDNQEKKIFYHRSYVHEGFISTLTNWLDENTY